MEKRIDIAEYAEARNNPYYRTGDRRPKDWPDDYEHPYGSTNKYMYSFDGITNGRCTANDSGMLEHLKSDPTNTVVLIAKDGYIERITANFVNAIFEEVQKFFGSTKALDRITHIEGLYDLDNKRKTFKRKALVAEKGDDWGGPMLLMIPDIGTELKLTHSWSFNLYNESRNMDLIGNMFLLGGVGWRDKTFDGRKVSNGEVLAEVTLAKDSILKVDRIYIRKGGEEYSSITFRVPKGTTFKKGKNVIVSKKNMRFWAKLGDVNKIKCRANLTTVRTDG